MLGWEVLGWEQVTGAFLLGGSSTLLNLHTVFNSVEVLMHSNTLSHNGILLLTDFIEIVKALFDSHNDGVG